MSRSRKYAASDEFIVWAQSLSGMLTKMKTEYGTIAEMVEHSAWDEGRTHYALALIQSLHGQLDAEGHRYFDVIWDYLHQMSFDHFLVHFSQRDENIGRQRWPASPLDLERSFTPRPTVRE